MRVFYFILADFAAKSRNVVRLYRLIPSINVFASVTSYPDIATALTHRMNSAKRKQMGIIYNLQHYLHFRQFSRNNSFIASYK